MIFRSKLTLVAVMAVMAVMAGWLWLTACGGDGRQNAGPAVARVLWSDSASMIAALQPEDRAALEPEWGRFLIDSQRQLHLAWQRDAGDFGLAPQRVEFSLGSSGAYNWRLIVLLQPAPEGADDNLSAPQHEPLRQWWREQSADLRRRAREHAESAMAARFG